MGGLPRSCICAWKGGDIGAERGETGGERRGSVGR